MANDYFRFKQFTIHQSDCAMKVGTDGVLLGAWVSPKEASTVLDIGTGTGLLALMVAQRSRAPIVALEPDPPACRQATENFRLSPWKDRMQVVNEKLQEYSCPYPFDMIICNPPFYNEETHSPLKERHIARHSASLALQDIIVFARDYLSENGQLNIILPSKREEELNYWLKENNLFVHRLCRVKATPEKESHRILAEVGHTNNIKEYSELIIELYERHQYSEEYIRLCRDYYLHM